MANATNHLVPARACKHWALCLVLLAAGSGVLWLLPAEVWAQLSTDNVKDKLEELLEAAKMVAWGILGIGAVVIAVKLNNGDPDTKQRAWQFLFAGLLIYMAADIITWLQS
jgi:hypothetical protein